jgi:hypothetical protein
MEQQEKVGKLSDNLDELTKLCNKRAKQIAKTITLNNCETKEVSFWTGDIPELICIGKFTKGINGEIAYSLDFSQSTL